jgi:transposase InsO family protein
MEVNMPWKETSIMDERVSFIMDYQAAQWSVSELCLEYGISRPTAYKYIARYEESGITGLLDLSRTPHTIANKTPASIEKDIIALRRKHPRYGPEKLLTKLVEAYPDKPWPALSTTELILKRNGLIPERRHIRRIQPINPVFDPEEPNHTWSTDYKGKFRTGDRNYVWPLTIADSFSRYLFAAQALEHPTFEATKAVFIRVFKEYGTPLQIHSDNGLPFACSTSLARLSSFAVWLLEHDILPVYSDPGHPEQNGRHERMHRELKAEAARPPAANKTLEQRKLNAFIEEYNNYRPHKALNNQTPASVHIHSPREYFSKVSPWDYPREFQVRRVYANGCIRWGAYNWIMVSTALIQKDIGLEELGNGIWRVYFRNKLLGYLEEQRLRIQDLKG